MSSERERERERESRDRRRSVSQQTHSFGLASSKEGKGGYLASSKHRHHGEDFKTTPRYVVTAPSQAPNVKEKPTRKLLPPSDGPYEDEIDYTIRQEPQHASQVDSISELTDEFDSVKLELALNPGPRNKHRIETADRSKQAEEFDPEYSVQEGWRFKFGKVFKILWPEPTGDGGNTMNSTYSQRISSKGRSIIQKTRRFVIIKKDTGHCICLPIMTYEGQGTTKRGVNPDDHAVIYTYNRPELLPGEKPLAKKDIKVVPLNPQHKLLPASRLCYSKVYTIELNVKVLFIGHVDKGDEWKIVAAYNDVNPPLPPRGKPSHSPSIPPSESTTGGASNYSNSLLPSSTPYPHVISTDHQLGTSSSSTTRGSMHPRTSEPGQSTNWQPSQMETYHDLRHSSWNPQQPSSQPQYVISDMQQPSYQQPKIHISQSQGQAPMHRRPSETGRSTNWRPPQMGTYGDLSHSSWNPQQPSSQPQYVIDDMQQPLYHQPKIHTSQNQGQPSVQSQYPQQQHSQYSLAQPPYQYVTNSTSQNYSYKDTRTRNHYEDHPTRPPHICQGQWCLDQSHRTHY